MHAEMTSFPSELISKMVHCVEEAVGSDIRAEWLILQLPIVYRHEFGTY